MLAFLLLAPASWLLPPVLSQSATATLSGTVEDASGAVVPGASVNVLNAATSLERQATTNDQGYFAISLLQRGTYIVTTRRAGFGVVQFKNIVLNVGDQKALKIVLKAGDVSATVQVTSEAPLINESPAVSTVVDRQFVENIPLNGRSFQSLITLTPGVVTVPASGLNGGQFSVNGSRAGSNSFMVDGVSANVGASPGSNASGQPAAGNLPGLTAFGTTQSLVSVDAMQEFQIQTSTYGAEYGRQPGGQISISTRSGTNEFHGSAFDYLRNEILDANDWFANRTRQVKPPMRQNDFGATLGGPVLLPRIGEGGPRVWSGKNRTFFFFSYEGLRLRLPKFALTRVPTLALRQQAPAAMQPILNSFPLPNGRDLGNGLAEFVATYSDPSSLDATSIRLDHTVSDKLSVFGRYNKAPSKGLNRVAPNNLSSIQSAKVDTQTITLGATAALTPGISNEFRFNYSDNGGTTAITQDSFGGAVPVPRSLLIPTQYDTSDTVQALVNLAIPGGAAVLTLIPKAVSSQRQYNVIDNFSYTVGSHQLKFGVDYRRLTPVYAANSYFIQTTFLSAQEILAARASSGLVRISKASRPVIENFSAYGQDAWRVSRDLTLTLGLRWEVNPPPSDATGLVPVAVTQVDNLATMQLAPIGTSQWQTTYNNLAPRIGVAYKLRENAGRETVLRGGFGLFYDTGNSLGAAGFAGNSNRNITNITYPLSPAQVAPPARPLGREDLTPPYPALQISDPSLKLPYTWQWNISVEQSLGNNQSLTASYVGAAGRRLIHQDQLNLVGVNPSFTSILLHNNHATSDYHALQAQFQRRLSRGIQALVSYTWAHALDEDSLGGTLRSPQRGNADFDVRHLLAGAITYDIPAPWKAPLVNAILSRWSVDTRFQVQTALPVDLTSGTVVNPVDFSLIAVRPNVVADVPWYVDAPAVPGGRKINRGAFTAAPAGQSGNLGRNQVRGLGSWQIDLAARREVRLTETFKLQIRWEAFNIFNHPNFGAISTDLNAQNFGEAANMLNRQLGGISQLYQIGGPRSMQLALKLLW
ncbi:MAG: TonB-dependent receptor [Acidobacteriota bacterium]